MRQAYKAMTQEAIASTEAQRRSGRSYPCRRDHGVDNMTIKLERTAGIDLGAEVDGIPLKMKIKFWNG